MLSVKSENRNWAKGRISGHLVNKETGEIRDAFEQDNLISYSGADIMARALAGEQNHIPTHIGFIYGAGPAPTLSAITRNQTWEDLSTELSDIGVTGNIVITPFACPPSFSVDGSDQLYTGNAVTLSGQSGNRLEYGFPVGAPYAAALGTGDYFYHAMLLNRRKEGNNTIYTPFARVTLDSGAGFLSKPAGFELAIFWQISYF